MIENTYTCCFCKEEFNGHGNSPWPLHNTGDACTNCNVTRVLPIRLMIKNFKNGKDEEYPHNDGE